MPIDTPAMRRKIQSRKAPVWVAIGGNRAGLKLGYRKGARGGVWIAKSVAANRRRETTLGLADDDNTGPGALSFTAAIAAALEWGARERACCRAAGGDYTRPTVASAVQSYIAAREQRDIRRGRDARSRLTKHVLSDEKFSKLALDDITPKLLREWSARKSALAPATLNRLQNDLRAALNAAVEMHGRELSASARQDIAVGLKSRPDAEKARRVILTDAEVKAVIAAAQDVDDDLGGLVLVLAATGCRFGQAAELTVGDLQVDARRILIPSSRKGRSTRFRPQIAVPIGDDVIARLKPLIVGRAGHEYLLERWISQQTGPCSWKRVLRSPWRAASEMTRGWAMALRSTPVVTGTPPYSLRHSSIARALRASVPVRIVAALHDTSSAMIEKHYAAHILDISDDLARFGITSLVSAPVSRLSVRAS